MSNSNPNTNGAPLHRPRRIGRPVPAAIPTAPIAFAWWWHALTYVRNFTASASMSERVEGHIRLYIVPFLRRLGYSHLSELTSVDVEEFSLELAGMDACESSVAQLYEVTYYTSEEAAVLGRCTVSKIKHLKREGKLPNHVFKVPPGKKRALLYIAAADLVALGFDLTGEKPSSRKHRTGQPLQRKVAAEVLSVLDRMYTTAVGARLVAHNPCVGVKAKDPVGTERANPEIILSLEQSRAVAAHLNVFYQLVFWFQRLMGLRVSEVYGLDIGSIWQEGDDRLVRVELNGGQLRPVRTANGSTTKRRRTRTKTKRSDRTLVIPPILVEFYDAYIDAVHRAPDGTVDPSAPLIPGFQSYEENSSAGYRQTLTAVGARLGIRLVRGEPAGLASHALRRSYSGELHHRNVHGRLNSLVLGQKPPLDGASPVTIDFYTPAPSDLAPLRDLALLVDHHARAEIGTLFVPTHAHALLGRDNPLRERVDVIAEVFAVHGYPRSGDRGEEFIDVATAAEHLDVAPGTVRKWIRAGQLSAVERDGEHSQGFYLLKFDDVEAVRRIRAETWTTGRVAEALGISQYELWRKTKEGRIEATYDAFTSTFRYTPETVERLRVASETERSIRSRAVGLNEACHTLGIGRKAAKLLLAQGLLERHEAPTGNGWIYVSIASVERVRALRHDHHELRTVGRKIDLDGCIPVAEASEAVGVSPRDLRSLADAGLLRRRDVGGRVYLFLEDLRRLDHTRGDSR